MNAHKNDELRAVIFDVDGTLAETERDGHRPAFNATFKKFGLNWHWNIEFYGKLLSIAGGKERLHYYIEKETPYLLNKKNLKKWVDNLHQEKNKHFIALLKQGKIQPRPGVIRLINQLRSKKIKIAVATTSSLENVMPLLKFVLGKDSLSWIDVIGAGDIVSQKKPAPDIYYWVLQRLGLSAQQCIAIEDSSNGLQAAQAANIPTLITLSNYTRQESFTGTIAVLSDLGELLQPFTAIKENVYNHQFVTLKMLLDIRKNYPSG